MKIALVGWGVETKSAYNYLGPEHNYLIVSEEPRDDFPADVNVEVRTLHAHRKPGLTSTVTDLSYMEGLESYDKVIFTPTSRKNLEKIYPENSHFWQIATSTLHIFFEEAPSKNIVGVTGTKGKGTTTTLIAKLLEAAGKTVHVGGNIGTPVLELLPNIKDNDWVVLELSSFQLYKFSYSPHIAVHLMMIPEHIDEWHHSMEDYVSSKRNIFANQSAEDIAVFNPKNEYSSQNVTVSQGKHIPYGEAPGALVEDNKLVIDNQTIISASEVALPGAHNLENICAAVTAAWQVAQEPEAFRSVLNSFKGLEHRLQQVATINDIIYIDDSFGTTPDTAVVAADAYTQPKVMIVGGHDKGNDFSPLIERLMRDDIRGIVCLGPTGSFIAKSLREKGATMLIEVKDDENDWTMNEIVGKATSMAESDDVVLLSTGAASFGIFADYKDRGEQFIAAVQKLATAPSPTD